MPALALAGLSLAAGQEYRHRLLILFTPEQEEAIGSKYSDELNRQLDLLEMPQVSDYIDELGRRLARHSTRGAGGFHFHVVNTGEVNTFALPGGHIYVHRGLIEATGSEDELAGALSHEIGHAASRHAIRHMSQKLLLDGILTDAEAKAESAGALEPVSSRGAYFMTLRYTPEDEAESDRVGIEQMSAAGFDPHGMLILLEKMARRGRPDRRTRSEFLQSHPIGPHRISQMRSAVRNLSRSRSAAGPSPAYLHLKAALARTPAHAGLRTAAGSSRDR